ncbi:response regulator transcription factor [Thalassospira sp. MCCC 1A03138]|uniref:response regulator n=1 Tax=Thalassospira sp. MCCC 1A03138 TaxID=1470576 RepID=UPI000A200EEA|nr:response regulator transcription factor [Thalassospira sp. MCCC 1A03138]OSQ27700.1 transcriptional regulator [Thalassospira sp. MCCC 1A03138]
MRILLVEDERYLAEAVRDHLLASGDAVDMTDSVVEAEIMLRGTPYDVLLLDLNLPDGKGIDLLRGMRRAGSVTPCIILTAQDQISDRIAGLNAGADDYLVKPFDLHELSARLLAVARRYSGNPNPLIRLSGDNGGAIEVDLASRSVVIDGQQTDLTSREWAVLDQLLRRPGATLSKAQLEEALYEFGAEIESNTVEVYISRLRRKLGKAVIHTVRGVGYRIEG